MLRDSYVNAYEGAAVVPPDLLSIMEQDITINDPPTHVLKPKLEKERKPGLPQTKRFVNA